MLSVLWGKQTCIRKWSGGSRLNHQNTANSQHLLCDGIGRSGCLETLAVTKVQDAVETIMKDFVSDKS
jgi:hypothetical protein